MTTSGIVSEFSIPAALPGGITTGSDGALWFTEQDLDRIGRITVGGVLTEFALPGPRAPSYIAAGPDGNLWFTEQAGRVGRITVSGQITEFSIPTPSGQPAVITAGPDGGMWFTELFAGQIGRVGVLAPSQSVPTLSWVGLAAIAVLLVAAGLALLHEAL